MKTVSEYVSTYARQPPALVVYKTCAEAFSKAVTLIVTVAAARMLAPEAFGVLALGMTTGWILGVASDAGLPLYLTRAVANAAGGTRVIVHDVMRLRVRFATVALVAGVAAAAALAPRGYVAAFILILVAQLAGAVLDTLSHVYRGLGRSEIESTIIVLHRLATAMLAAIVLTTRPALLPLSLALVVPPIVALGVSIAIARRLTTATGNDGALPVERRSRFTFADFTRDAAPIGMGVLLSALYFRCDVYFVGYWHGLEPVGMYNAVFRLVEAMRLFPAAVLAVVFPELCRARGFGPMRRLALGLTSAGVVAMVLVLATASPIVQIVYGAAYLPAAPALRVLALSLPLFFLNYALTHQVIGWNGQRAYAAIACAALVANVTGNVLLIPSLGMAGAAWSTLVTEIVVALGCVGVLPRAMPSGSRESARDAGEIAETAKKGTVPFLAEIATREGLAETAPRTDRAAAPLP